MENIYNDMEKEWLQQDNNRLTKIQKEIKATFQYNYDYYYQQYCNENPFMSEIEKKRVKDVFEFLKVYA